MFEFDFKLLDVDHRIFLSMNKSFADLSKNPTSNAQCSVPHQPGPRASINWKIRRRKMFHTRTFYHEVRL